MLTSTVIFGQVEIHNDYQPGIILNGTILNSGIPNPHLQIVNKSGSSKNYSWKRTVLNTDVTNLYDQVCDNAVCFNINTVTWNSVNYSITILNNDSTKFQPKLAIPDESEASALIRYYVVESGNVDVIIDSVDIQYNTFLNIENTSIDFNVYPNPANNILNISISENNTFISLFDIVGKKVSEMELLNGNNTLNIENLNPGIYFYSIKRNGNIIETKKLVVQ
jgi:hypothetical protein